MDEISTLRDTFDPAVASEEAEQRARAALQARMASSLPARMDSAAPRPRPRLRLPIAVGSSVMATAVVAAFAVASLHRPGDVARPPGVPSISPPAAKAAAPYLRPVSAAQILENAAWSAEQEKWIDPTPQQFMYVETLEMRNQTAYQREHPNGVMVPGKAKYEKSQRWDRIDGKVMASIRNGKLVVEKQGDGGGYWIRLDWSRIVGLTTPEKISAWVADPGPISMDIDAMAGQYVLPPAVKAAIFRYLAEQPGMKVNPDAVNIDGRPAIGLGRIEEGYLSQELLFDKQTYALVGERLVVIRDHTNHALDGDVKMHKGDLLRQVIYNKMLIVDRPGDGV